MMQPTINQRVIMSGVDYFDDGQAINPFMDATMQIDLDKAAVEHAKIRQALESAGVNVLQVTPPEGCQDGVYTANWALVRDNKAVMSRLPGARKAEEAYAEQILREQGKEIIHIPGPANGCGSSSCIFSPRGADRAVSKYGEASTGEEKYAGAGQSDPGDGSAADQNEQCSCLRFSGQGDALPCGNYLFCGSTYRSDVEAQQFVAEQLGYERIQLRTIPQLDTDGNPVINSYSGWADSFYYDIDLALSVLKFPDGDQKGLIAWCPDAFTPESQDLLRNFDAVDKIEVSAKEATEAFACNLVSTGEVVVMNASAVEFAAAIEAHGLKTIGLSNPELGKGGGSIRCTTLSLDNA